jgi:hypothetical protein
MIAPRDFVWPARSRPAPDELPSRPLTRPPLLVEELPSAERAAIYRELQRELDEDRADRQLAAWRRSRRRLLLRFVLPLIGGIVTLLLAAGAL